MGRRERLERKVEKREEWAEKAKGRSEAAFNRADSIAKNIPLGQPILVGHHSERHARADQKRIHNAMDKGCEEASLASHHRSKAAGLERQLERSIFSDDSGAVEKLEAKTKTLEAARDRRKEINAAYRAAPGATPWDKLDAMQAAGSITEPERAQAARTFRIASYEKQPFPPYSLTNIGAEIRRARERIEQIKLRLQRAAEAEVAGGVVVKHMGKPLETGPDYCRVTFAAKPEREVLNALRGACFSWGNGGWTGETDKLPDAVKALLPAPTPEAAQTDTSPEVGDTKVIRRADGSV